MAAKNSAKSSTPLTSVSASDDRERALETALSQIERQFGKGSVMRLGDEGRAPIEVIPTGSIALDVALGIGGLPRGRIIEVYGPESSGKTTVALHAIASVQALGGLAAFIDAEHALDLNYAKALGVNSEELLISQPDCGEQALEITETLVRSGALSHPDVAGRRLAPPGGVTTPRRPSRRARKADVSPCKKAAAQGRLGAGTGMPPSREPASAMFISDCNHNAPSCASIATM